MTTAFVHDVPASRVIFENGSLARVGEEVARLGASRVLLVCADSESALGDRIVEDLGDQVVARFVDVAMHVPVPIARRAVALSQQSRADCVVTVGGGSSTGMAKFVARETGLPILAVPTTYAGSEMTSIWGHTEGQRKMTGRDPVVLPRVVIYDPTLTLSLPIHISAASAMNALAHLVEGLYSPGISPMLFLQAEEGVRALVDALPRIIDDPGDLQARGDALYGAWLGGWILGTTSMGLHHKICHVLGGMFDLDHAATHSAVLPHVTAYNAQMAPNAMQALERAMSFAQGPCGVPAVALWEFAVRIQAPTSLKELGFPLSAVDEVAQNVVNAAIVNPRPVDVEGVRRIILAAYEGGKP